MQKVAAYCRVSTDKEEQIHSLNNQRLYFFRYIRQHPDWMLVQIYYDEGISGTQAAKRPGFHQMIQDALNGKLDLILTKEVSRFARNTVDALFFTRMLKEKQVGVIFILDHIDTRACDGELRLTIMASLAQEESRKISERVKWGQKRQMERGIVFGRDLFGYSVQKGSLIVNPKEAAVVQTIFYKYTKEGKNAHAIARELLSEGIYPKHAKNWSAGVILKILRNEKYVGDLCQKKTITPDYLTHKKKYNHGEEEFVYISHHHTPIISRDLWNQTQQELLRRSRSKKKSSLPSLSLYSKKLICGQCGRYYLHRVKQRKDGSLYELWYCPTCSHSSLRHPSLLCCLGACQIYLKETPLVFSPLFLPKMPSPCSSSTPATFSSQEISTSSLEEFISCFIQKIVIQTPGLLEIHVWNLPSKILISYLCSGRGIHFQTKISSISLQQTI